MASAAGNFGKELRGLGGARPGASDNSAAMNGAKSDPPTKIPRGSVQAAVREHPANAGHAAHSGAMHSATVADVKPMDNDPAPMGVSVKDHPANGGHAPGCGADADGDLVNDCP